MNLDEAMSAAAEHLAGAETTTEAVEAAPVETTPETPAADAPPSPAPSPERARGDDGRFTKAQKAAAAAKAAKVTEKPAGTAPTGGVHGAAQVAPPAGQVPADGAAPSPAPSAEAASPLKLPSSWKPGAREALAKAPREVQEEAIRIDREVRQVMQEAAESKKTAETVHRTLAPFEGIARANGMDVMSYAGSVMQTAAQLFQGPPGNRPALIAQLIKAAGVKPEDVNPYLSGEAEPPRQQPAQPAFDPRAEVHRVLEEERVQADVRAFSETQPEFLNDVWPDMVGLIEADKRAGRKPDLKGAYDRACWANPDVRAALMKKQAAEQARTQTQATAQARAAAVSIKSRPAAPNIGAKPKGIDGAIAAAREKLGM